MILPCFVFAVMLQLYSCGTKSACPDNCKCLNVQRAVMCSRDDVPKRIPEGTKQVFIEKMNLENVKHGVFEDDSWTSLSVLDITANRGKRLYNHSFVGLNNLSILGVHGLLLRNIQPHVFAGLDSLHTLDFSSNKELAFSQFKNIFDVTNQLPLLRNLTIADLMNKDITNFDAQILKFGSWHKTLTYLDMSGLNFGIVDLDSFEKLFCNSLIHLKASRIALGYPEGAYRTEPCSSLRTLDISDAHLPLLNQGLTELECNSVKFINNVETLIASGVFRSETNLNLQLDLRCSFSLKKIDLRNNNLRWINMTVNVSENLQKTLLEIDVSNNIIEFIAPSVIYPSQNLEILILTNNKLSKMQIEYQDTFAVLLSRSHNIKRLYLADNMILDIPKQFFDNNKNLQFIDLSRNKLRSLNFNVQKLAKLKYLDLHSNQFYSLDLATRQSLSIPFTSRITAADSRHQSIYTTMETAHDDPQMVHTSVYFQINFGSNRFQCNCEKESMETVEWLDTSKHVDREKGTYTCEFEDQTIHIFHSALTTIKSSCYNKYLISILRIVVPAIVVLCILLIVFSLLFRRRRRKVKRYNDFLNELKQHRFINRFLVFLSFCSEDYEFVLTNIAKQLQDKLSEITGNARNFVCIGDHEFQLGLMVHEEVMRCMEESSVVMFIVSNTFCKKNWCKMEVKEAYNQQKPIIMFMKERVETEDMPRILQRIFNRYTHAAWVDDVSGGHCEPSMQKMCESIVEMARKSAMDALNDMNDRNNAMDEGGDRAYELDELKGRDHQLHVDEMTDGAYEMDKMNDRDNGMRDMNYRN